MSPESVDAYVDSRPDWARELLMRLRELVRTTVPQAEECVKYTVPFYTYHGLFCFLSAKRDHVVLALCEGASLPDPFGLLTGDQKQLRHIEVSPRDTFPEKEIRYMLVEAARFNEMRQRVKRMKTKNVNRNV